MPDLMHILMTMFAVLLTGVGVVHMIEMMRFKWAEYGRIDLMDIFFFMAILVFSVMSVYAINFYIP